eukprot:1196232-Prorocentrum_minimum.AAC.3
MDYTPDYTPCCTCISVLQPPNWLLRIYFGIAPPITPPVAHFDILRNPEVTKARADNSFGTNFENSPEPIYGTQFLPRKFKVAVTVPGDNSVDLFTNDLGVVVLCNDQGELMGANLYVGGGMGRSHRNSDTAPYLAGAYFRRRKALGSTYV